jgi:hypothetical protein
LAKGVEYQVIGDSKQLDDVALLEGGGEAMYLPAKLFPSQACFPGGAGADTVQRLTDQRKDTPHGKGLQRKQDLCPASLLHAVQDGQVMTQAPQVYNVSGGWGELEDFFDINAGHGNLSHFNGNVWCVDAIEHKKTLEPQRRKERKGKSGGYLTKVFHLISSNLCRHNYLISWRSLRLCGK